MESPRFLVCSELEGLTLKFPSREVHSLTAMSATSPVHWAPRVTRCRVNTLRSCSPHSQGPCRQVVLYELLTSREVTGLSKVFQWHVILVPSYFQTSTTLCYLRRLKKKFDKIFKGTLGLRLSMVTTPDASYDSLSCATFCRLTAGPKSTAAGLPPWFCCLPGDWGPGI